jgi:transcriptional regulator with XRE-family HTH domain
MPTIKPKRRKRIIKTKERQEILRSFGQHFKDLRQAKGLSTIAFEKLSGIDSSNLIKYENGSREPGLGVIALMAKGLGIPIKKLVDFPFEFDE